MGIGLRLVLWGQGLGLGSWLGRELGSGLGFYFQQYCTISHNFTHSALRRRGMSIALRLGLWPVVRFRVRVRVDKISSRMLINSHSATKIA